MSRIVSLGIAEQNMIMIDRDDFESLPLGGQSIFSKMTMGSHIDIDKATLTVGGGGLNAAVTFARLGHETILMSNLAHDAAGEAVIDCLDTENIDSSYIEYLRGSTGCSVTLVDAKTAERTVLNFKGVSARADNLAASDLELVQPDWLYASSVNGDMNTLLEFFEKAHALDAKVLFRPGAAELAETKKLIGLLEDVDVLVLNKTQAAKIVPGVVLTELLSHLANYCETVIITDGEMGAIATNHEKTYRLGVYEQKRVRDTTGVGDAFASGFLASLSETGKFRRSLIFAAANAAKVSQKYGSTSGILSKFTDLHPMPIQEIKP